MTAATRTDAAALEPHELLGHAFKRALASVRRLRGRETHHPDELSNAQYGLLFSLAVAPEMSARDLADAAGVTPATVTPMLDALAAAGLVRRRRCATDKRVVLTALTELGHTRIQEHRARVEPLWRAALAGFSDAELITAATVLDRLAAHFDELAESPGFGSDHAEARTPASQARR
jgi:DNA-binding MarR family transcriptional regulator